MSKSKLCLQRMSKKCRRGVYLGALYLHRKLKRNFGVDVFDLNIVFLKSMKKTLLQKRYHLEISDRQQERTVRKRRKNDDICLIRIIGNDLPGLHDEQQSLENLEFILKNEKYFSGVYKVFLINRVVSQDKRQKIKELLNAHNAPYIEQAFNAEEFVRIPIFYGDLPNERWLKNKNLSRWEQLCWQVALRKKRNAYLMNNNGARNYALSYGIKNGYQWVLPWDGNCFLSDKQYQEIRRVTASPDNKAEYLIVPMERCLNNSPILSTSDSTNAVEEPQIIFKASAKHKFDSERVYGNQPKVELLRRLSVPGPWDNWYYEYPWQKVNFKSVEKNTSKWCEVSSVFRLSSGNPDAATNTKNRTHSRAAAITSFIDEVYDFSKKKLAAKSKTDFLYYRQVEKDKIVESADLKTVNSVFDKIYLVSLKHDLEKRLKVGRQLMSLGIDYEWFEAVNGYEGQPLKDYQEYAKRPIGDLSYFVEHSDYEKQRGIKLIESPGALGYIYTYISIIKDAKINGCKNVLVLEDDIILCDNFNQRFNRFIESVGDNWKILHLSASQYEWDSIDQSRSLSDGFFIPRLHRTKGSFAIGLNESIYDELVQKQIYLDAPFDNLPIGYLYEKYIGSCFVAYPFLVMPDVSKSAIREERSQYQHANRVGWWVPDFKYPILKPCIGIVLKSKLNLKYLECKLNADLPCVINFFFVNENGISPLHNKSSLPEDYLIGSINSDFYKYFTLPLDLLLEVDADIALTEELILEAIVGAFSNNLVKDEFNKVDLSHASRVKGRVSVIVPTYKRPRHLKASMESVLEQDYHDIELIVVDDNGIKSKFSFETNKLVEDCARRYPERSVRLLQHVVNANGAAARNTGVLTSTGEYICFLDDDDVYLQGRISKSVQEIKYQDELVGGVYCGFLGWNSPELDVDRFKVGDLRKEIFMLDYHKHYLHTNTATYKASAVARINGFDESYRRHQDLEFNIRFFEHYSIGAVKDTLVRLAPEKSSVDNKLYGVELLKLKRKFLADFSYLISQFSPEEQNAIYEAQWKEVVRFAKKKEHRKNVLDLVRSEMENGPLQISLMLD